MDTRSRCRFLESALVLYHLPHVNPSRIHLTVPRDNYPCAAGGDLYRLHRRALDATDITEVDGIPTTVVDRTESAKYSLASLHHGTPPSARRKEIVRLPPP